jgi:hypothetical protein
MESTIETQTPTILRFTHGLKGTWYVTFGEGTYSAWLCFFLHWKKVCSDTPT